MKLPRIGLLCHRIALIFVARKVLAILAGYITYEATHIPTKKVSKLAKTAKKNLENEGFLVKAVSLHLSGTSYDATVAVAQQLQNSRVCTVHAQGINKCVEEKMVELAKNDKAFGSYSLFVNGPSVGYSNGLPTSYQIPAATQAGIQYAEQELKAKSIIVLGHSFGGGFGPIGLSRHLQHNRNKEIRYLAISHCSFSDLKSIAALTRAQILSPIFTLLGFQLDNIEASRILSAANVTHIVIQGEEGSDPIIPDAVSLAEVLKNKEITDSKVFITSKEISHSGPLPRKQQKQFNKTIRNFINNENCLKNTV